MRKIKFTIPEQCHENWDRMTKTEKGKFCNACSKTVFDFTNMSDRQLAEFFKKPPASVCGRFQRSQLNRDILIPRKRIPWIKYFFQFSLPAFLFSARASAQGMVRVKDSASTVIVNKSPSSKDIKRRNEKDARVEIQGASGPDLKNSETGFDIKQMKTMVQCDYVTTTTLGMVSIPRRKSLRAIPFIKNAIGKVLRKVNDTVAKHVVDTASRKFVIYPNPIRVNVPFKINTKNLENGMYTLRILTVESEIVQQSEVVIENKNQLVDFVMEEASAGIYFVRFTNKKSGKSFTEKILLQ